MKYQYIYENTDKAIPACITAETPSANTSEKYKFISTARVLEVLIKEGWNIAKIRTTRPRTNDPMHARHAVELDHPVHSLLSNNERFRITIVNAHNGSCSFRFYVGVFRLLCENGLIVGEGLQYRVRHVGYTDEKVKAILRDVLKRSESVAVSMNKMKSTVLTDVEYRDFLSKSALNIKSPVFSERLGWIRREADKGLSLWNAFNRVQENALRGGIKYTTRDNKDRVRRQTTRPIKAIDKQIKVNRILWNTAMEFVK